MNEIILRGRGKDEPVKIKYDIDLSVIAINGHLIKIEENRTYFYKFLKTKIKCIGGINGFLKSIKEANSSDFYYYYSHYIRGAVEKYYKKLGAN